MRPHAVILTAGASIVGDPRQRHGSSERTPAQDQGRLLAVRNQHHHDRAPRAIGAHVTGQHLARRTRGRVTYRPSSDPAPGDQERLTPRSVRSASRLGVPEAPWDDPDALRAPPSGREPLELARRFSLHVEGMPLLYNLVVAERRREVLDSDEAESIEEFRGDLAEWATRKADEKTYQPEPLWELVTRRGGRLPYSQRLFVESWSQRIAELEPAEVADDDRLRTLVADRELRLKGGRARLANRNRLVDWSPGVGVGRMDFRWFRVRQFLIDLHRGLAA